LTLTARLANVTLFMLLVAGCNDAEIPYSSEIVRPATAATLAPNEPFRNDERGRIIDSVLAGAVSISNVAGPHGDLVVETALHIAFIRSRESGDLSADFPETTQSRALCEMIAYSHDFVCLLRDWAIRVRDGHQGIVMSLWSGYGASTLFADVAIHGGEGDSALRALVALTFGGLGDFDLTVSAEYSRHAAVLAALPDTSARVNWVLSTPISQRMRELLLFNLRDEAVNVLADLYEDSGRQGGLGVNRDELAWLFARVAVGRQHPARARLLASDLARSDIAQFVQRRDVAAKRGFNREDLFINRFFEDEERPVPIGDADSRLT
jgi:hypothetical protein